MGWRASWHFTFILYHQKEEDKQWIAKKQDHNIVDALGALT